MSRDNTISNTIRTPSDIAQTITNARPGGISREGNLTSTQIENKIAQLRARLASDIELIKKQLDKGKVTDQVAKEVTEARIKEVETHIKELEEKRQGFVALDKSNQDGLWKLQNDSLDGINKAIELGSLNVYWSWEQTLNNL